MEALAEADQDVLPRAQTAQLLSAIPSRRASRATASGRGTPDSDGFGYSGFEEDVPEPIPPPAQVGRCYMGPLGCSGQGIVRGLFRFC